MNAAVPKLFWPKYPLLIVFHPFLHIPSLVNYPNFMKWQCDRVQVILQDSLPRKVTSQVLFQVAAHVQQKNRTEEQPLLIICLSSDNS